MQTQVTLRLSDRLYRSATRLAAGVKRPVRAVLTDVLSSALDAWDVKEDAIEHWSDQRVLSQCDAQMSLRQSERLSELLDRQQSGQLTVDEKPELWALMASTRQDNCVKPKPWRKPCGGLQAQRNA
ncbi:hypothetical protein [Candidatus Amarolinea dominans]|uniref:hypothetical protein n=1 Tax=Candidatus Amarolinea dominans TaxID=3140696 RepID=UPI003136BBD1|nr:hypothetical protein [Anaerolineae bacterium]